MSADDVVQDCFDRLLARRDRSGRIPFQTNGERATWYVVSARCEIDINGFESVFEQLFTEEEVAVLVCSLNELDELELARLVEAAHTILSESGFYRTSARSVLNLPSGVQQRLRQIAEAIGDKLWLLDVKIATLIDSEANC